MLENSSTSNLSRIEIKRLELLKDLSEIHSSTLLNLFTWLKQQNTRWINFDVIRETLPRLSLTYNQERNYGMRPIEFETNDSLTHFLCFVNRAAKLVAYRKLYFVLLDHFFVFYGGEAFVLSFVHTSNYSFRNSFFFRFGSKHKLQIWETEWSSNNGDQHRCQDFSTNYSQYLNK